MSELIQENELRSVIVGTRYRGQAAIDAIARMRPGDSVRLERENHPNDIYAIQCHYLGTFVGYIPKLVNTRIAPQMDSGSIATAVVETSAVIRRGNFIQTEPKLRITLGEPQQ